MRILWVDADQNPWTAASGWKTMEDFGVELKRVALVNDAKLPLLAKEYEAIVVRAEIPQAQELLVNARQLLGKGSRKIILISSQWKKEEFKAHSKTPGAAHRYARVPMPPEGFLSLLADLYGLGIDELREFRVLEEEPAIPEPAPVLRPEPVRVAPAPAPVKRTPRPSHADSEDIELLRKYLRLKEEQLEIAEANKDELVNETERYQKEAHELQLRLREMEHLHHEISKKLAAMEEERLQTERERAHEKEAHEHQAKVHGDKIKNLETQLGSANEKYENLRVRVRKDIRKIRGNERDLEARLELLRKDSETLLSARDQKVLDLQRKIDALEFDLDQVQDSRVQAQMESERYLAKLSRVARALHIAVSMIEDDHSGEEELDELEPLVGGAAVKETIVAAEPDESGEDNGGSGSASGAPPSEPPAGAETPPPDDVSAMAEAAGAEGLSADLAALANDGEPTQMVNIQALEKMGGGGES
jgi:hypothetical protein